MFSANYITHLTVIRKALVNQVGGFRKEFDGAQDWDLFFRVSEHSGKIFHIPKVLYHWRDSAESTARNIHKKDYAPRAQLHAIRAYMERRGFISPEAFFDASGFIRVRWQSEHTPKVSIIIPSNGVNRLLKRCIGSIVDKTRYSHYEVVIVNNGKQKPDEFRYYQQLQKDSRFRIVHDDRRPFNYSAVNNLGVSHASGEVLVFLNNDTVILSEDWLNEFVMWASHPEIGIVGAKLLMPDKTIQHAGVIVGLTGLAGHVFAGLPEAQNTMFGLTEWYRNYLAVTAACLAVQRSIFEDVGGFNEKLVLCGNDVELCFRVRDAGFRNVYNPFIKLMHEESATREGPIPTGDYHESYKCYRPFLENGDPYFNVNLSMWRLVPELRKTSDINPNEFMIDLLRTLEN
jgi:GT2 family glycosyltransferase